jgi:hypothetical protein
MGGLSESGYPGFKDEQDEDWEQLKNTNSFELILPTHAVWSISIYSKRYNLQSTTKR